MGRPLMTSMTFGKRPLILYFVGSKRNRMSKEDNIFLDMNYINHMRDNPVYIDKASHSGKLATSGLIIEPEVESFVDLLD